MWKEMEGYEMVNDEMEQCKIKDEMRQMWLETAVHSTNSQQRSHLLMQEPWEDITLYDLSPHPCTRINDKSKELVALSIGEIWGMVGTWNCSEGPGCMHHARLLAANLVTVCLNEECCLNTREEYRYWSATECQVRDTNARDDLIWNVLCQRPR